MKKNKPRFISAISDSMLPPLGKVTANFAVLELMLSSLIGALVFVGMRFDQRVGDIITAGLNFNNKIDLFSSLFQHKFPQKKPFDELKSINKRLAVINKKRNQLIHSTWGASEGNDSNTIMKKSARRKSGLEFQSETIKVADIYEIAAEIGILAYDLQMFRRKEIDQMKI